MAVVSLGQSPSPDCQIFCGRQPRSVQFTPRKLLAFGVTLGVCEWLFQIGGREILTILFRPICERAELLPWIMAAGGVCFGQFLGFGMTAAGYYNSQVILNIWQT